jgi:hypothetical protein
LRKFVTFLKANPKVIENFKNLWEIFGYRFVMMKNS